MGGVIGVATNKYSICVRCASHSIIMDADQDAETIHNTNLIMSLLLMLIRSYDYAYTLR